MVRVPLSIALLCLAPAFAQEDTPPPAEGEVQLVSESLEVLPWYASVSGFAMSRGLKCSVAPVGTAGISIKGGSAAERELLVEVARLFDAEGGGGSAVKRDHGYAPPVKLGEDLWVRRTDFARTEDAQRAFNRVRNLLVSPLPGVRKVSVYSVTDRVVVIGEQQLTVHLLGGAVDAIKSCLPPPPPELGGWKAECARLAERYDAAGDAAYDWAFGGHFDQPTPLKQARQDLAIAESCQRAMDLWDEAHAMRTSIGIELAEERAQLLADRLSYLPRQTAGFFREAAEALEAAGDAEAAAKARAQAELLDGE